MIVTRETASRLDMITNARKHLLMYSIVDEGSRVSTSDQQKHHDTKKTVRFTNTLQYGSNFVSHRPYCILMQNVDRNSKINCTIAVTSKDPLF